MPTGGGNLADLIGILLVLVLVAANGFFVAAEFSLVAVRRSRVAELAQPGSETRRRFKGLATISIPISRRLSLALRFRHWR
jgi:CBS domain containing-hemolysin-like protein